MTMNELIVGEAHPPPDWPRTYEEAVALQEELRQRVRLVPLPRPPRLVAGADAICNRADTRIFGAVAVYRYPELDLMEEAGVAGECPFPYRTGLLSFREVPILAAALARLKKRPDVVLVDGQGIAHPRGLGLATHLGLVADIPTIGVAKSRLVGEGQVPELAAGSYNPLIWKEKQVGLILRTQKGKNPLYLSPGHRITLPECLEITLGCVTTYRLPLPVRQADLLSRRLRGLGPQEALT
jgi:deoxyribonuclease V